MRLLTAFAIYLAVPAFAQSTLTFADALALARNKTASQAAPVVPDVSAFRRRYPDVRAEATAGRSRSLDIFADGPLDISSTNAVITFDYPLWDGGLRSSRLDSLEWRTRRLQRRDLDDARFAQLVDAFGDLYLAQRQMQIVRPVAERMASDASRTQELIASGDLSNIMAVERREVALGVSARMLEIDARRVHAAARLRLLTGIAQEPDVVLDLAEPVVESINGTVLRDEWIDAASMALDEARARLHQARAANGFQARLSGTLGFGAAQSDFRGEESSGSFGVYGLRVHVSYPLFDWSPRVGVVEAAVELAHATLAKEAAEEAASARAAEYLMRRESAEERIELLRRSVEAGREREESLRRLVEAGARSESELAQAVADRTLREGERLAAEVEQWKAGQLLTRMTAGDGRLGQSDQP